MDSPDGPEERYCPSCGESLKPADRYCPSCGWRVDSSDAGQETANTGGQQRPTAGPDEPVAPPESGRPAGKPRAGNPGSKADEESPLLTMGAGVALAAGGIIVPLVILLPITLLSSVLPVPGIIVGPTLILLQFVLFVTFGLGYLHWRGYSWDGVKTYLGVDTPSIRDIGLILLTWFGMLVVTLVVANVVVQVLPELVGTEQTEPASNPISETIEQNPEVVLLAIAFMFLVVGPAEEILFRGVVQNRLREGLPRIPAILLASALFASVHIIALLGQGPIAIAQTIVILFIPSLGLGFIYEYTGNIVVPALLHGFHNSVLVLITAIGAVYGPEQTALIPPVIADLVAAVL